MSVTSSCPRCQKQVTIPDGLGAASLVRCPLCEAEYRIARGAGPADADRRGGQDRRRPADRAGRRAGPLRPGRRAGSRCRGTRTPGRGACRARVAPGRRSLDERLGRMRATQPRRSTPKRRATRRSSGPLPASFRPPRRATAAGACRRDCPAARRSKGRSRQRRRRRCRSRCRADAVAAESRIRCGSPLAWSFPHSWLSRSSTGCATSSPSSAAKRTTKRGSDLPFVQHTYKHWCWLDAVEVEHPARREHGKQGKDRRQQHPGAQGLTEIHGPIDAQGR